MRIQFYVLCLILGFLPSPFSKTHAQTHTSLIYPLSWCENAAAPLHFTMAQLGTSEFFQVIAPSRGTLSLHSLPAEGGTYLPDCDSLLAARFDYFQLQSQIDGALTNVTVVLSIDDGDNQVGEEGAPGGQIGPAWQLAGAVQIVPWTDADRLEGDFGFRVEGPQLSESDLTFLYQDWQALQPDAGQEGTGNNGTTTTIIVRPPTQPPPGGWTALAEQLIYSSGADGQMPGTALRLRQEGGVFSIRGEAAQLTAAGVERLTTDWCPLEDGANTVKIAHVHRFSENSLLTLDIEDCTKTESHFTSAYSASPRHRFGVIEPQNGGVAYDFDHVTVASYRYQPERLVENIDDFESGSFAADWTLVGSPIVTGWAAHTGSYGFEIQPTLGTPAYIESGLQQAAQDFACHFSLDGEIALGASSAGSGRLRLFSASGGGSDQIRLWVRQRNSAYQVRIHSGPAHSGWLTLDSLPARVEFRLADGALELWLNGCGPDAANCHVPHRVENASAQPVAFFRAGQIALTAEMPERLSIDNFSCLVGLEPAP